MTDVFDALIGQEHVAATLRHHARRPVHAYLFTGPTGSSLRETVTAFAAALQCLDAGCGRCEACRLVLTGNDPDVTFVERAGLAWRVAEIREAERVSRRRPLGRGRQIVVLEDAELTTTGATPSAASLLKSLEEPPARTVFLLTSGDPGPEMDTIVSRCVSVALRALSDSDVATILTREGVDARAAADASVAAGGDLARARVLARDADLGARVAQWRAVPERLNGTPAMATRLVAEIVDALDRAVAPLAQVQAEEMARRAEEARSMGQRPPTRRDLEAQFKREQRRFRTDDLRFGLTALTQSYRERLATDLEANDPRVAASARVGAALRALDDIAETNRRLTLNVDETLLLTDLLLSLTDL